MRKAFFVLNLAPSFFLSLLFAGVVVVSFIESQETRRETAEEVDVKIATLNNTWRRVGKVREYIATSAVCFVVDIAMLDNHWRRNEKVGEIVATSADAPI